MGREPPAPIQGVIGSSHLFPGHAIGLQTEIANEMCKGQEDEKVESCQRNLNAHNVTLGEIPQPNFCKKRQHGVRATDGAMEGDEAQTSRVRERLKLLLSTHLPQLEHIVLRPGVGDVLIEEGAKAERLLLVVTGQLSVEVRDGHGHPQIVAMVGADELVGEMGLVGDYCHTATVRVHEGPAEVLSVQADDLLKATLFDNDLVMELLALSSERCQQSNHRFSLVLEALESLSRGDIESLDQSCEILATKTGASAKAAQLLQLLKQQHRQTAAADGSPT